MRKELAPGGYIRQWLEGDRTPNEILTFLKTLMPLVRELEKVHHEGSQHREIQALAVDPHSIPHQYRLELTTPDKKSQMGHGTIVADGDEAYLVTARHVIDGTLSAGSFSVMRDEKGIPDVAAAPIDMQKSLPVLEKIRPATSASPHLALARVARDTGDRSGRLFLFSSEMHNEFDFTLRLALPLTPSLCNALFMLGQPQGLKLLNTPFSQRTQTDRAKIMQLVATRDVCFIGPEDFSDPVATGPFKGMLRAQGRSGSDVFDADTLEYHGPFTEVSIKRISGINRSVLFADRGNVVARLCAAIRTERIPRVAINEIRGLELTSPKKWLTWIEKAGDEPTGRFDFGAGLKR